MDIGDRTKVDNKGELFDFVNTTENLKALGLHVETGLHHQGSEPKETNNNHLMVNMSQFDDAWPNLDSSMLDELNNWTQEGGGGSVKTDNTDGAIYTLTVLNGTEQGTWFKHEEKEDKNIDIDSLLNVIPAAFPTAFHPEEAAFADPTFVEKKEDITRVSEIINNSSSFNNNNEWKQENNNEVDSLLRNALQGKAPCSRYNGIKVEKKEPEDEDKIMLNSPILYDSSTMVDSDNPSSAHSMDEIFLSHLDIPSFQDMEKLRRIRTEVEASAGQYLEGSYLPSGSQVLSPLILQKPSKKYSKRSKSTGSSPGGSSTGIRKERSLHYCNICSKGFKDKYSVNVHIRTHTGEKPFTCSLCAKSFRQKAHLAKHYQTHMAQAKNGVATNQKPSKNLISSS